MDLRNKVVLITGAARGIGRCMAQEFGGAGARLGLADVLRDSLEETVVALRERGVSVTGCQADTTVASEVESMVRRIEEALGPVDVLINNAGTFSVIAPIWQADPEKWAHDIYVNLLGSFYCTRHVLPEMVKRRAGCVINVVSGGGVGDPHPYCTSYASSKAGLMRMTEGLAKEVETFGIRVFALAPPAVLTDMTRFIIQDTGGQKWRPEFSRVFDEKKDLPPEEVARAAVRLASGDLDQLHGRYIRANADFAALAKRVDEIVSKDLLTLRIRELS